MKQLFVCIGLLVMPGWACAQSDAINLQKYWKLRSDFREDFVKIGPNSGESLAARGLKPLDCVDNLTSDGTGYAATPNGYYGHGEIHWGDAMIRHGYYLGLLATEYKLLKDDGQDVTGVLNELYYALNAINRLDKLAEVEQGAIYGYSPGPQLNGFYMREDIPSNFASDNWANSRLEARCVNSAHYETNNAMGIQNPSNNEHAKGNSYQNSPSSDQLSSLMVGLSLVHKLVDDIYVKPVSTDQGFFLIGETKAIVDRLIGYVNQHNWMMIDLNGWPVNNGGGDVFIHAYPLYLAAKRITNHDYVADWQRRTASFFLNNVQYCVTGYGLESNDPFGRIEACDDIVNPLSVAAYNSLHMSGVPAGPANSQNTSAYQSWLLMGDLGGAYDITANYWTNAGTFVADVVDDGKLSLLPFPLSTIKMFDPPTGMNDNSSLAIISNYGVAAGIWNGTTVKDLSAITGNYQLELINAVIRNEAAPNTKAYYQGFLNNMSKNGPYNFVAGSQYVTLQSGSPNGWASEHKWTWSSQASGSTGSVGIFNGLDYMLMHNLYYLKFKTSLPVYKQNDECYCATTPQMTNSGIPVPQGETQANINAMVNTINTKLTFINTCSENVFAPVNNSLSNVLNIQPYFANYSDLGIYTWKFQTQDATVNATGEVNVKTYFKICNGKTLTINSGGGRMDIEKAGVSVGSTAKIDCSGIITVKSGTTLTIEGKLILRNGAKLHIEENASVIIEPGAILEFYGGANIYMYGPTSKLILKSSIKIMDAGEFKITHLGTSAGKLIVDNISAGLLTATPNTGKYTLVGKGKTDPFIILYPNAKLWAMDNFAESVTIDAARVEFGAGATLMCNQPFYSSYVEYASTATNGGLRLSETAVLEYCKFVNVPVVDAMDIEHKGTFKALGCYFIDDNPALNPTSQALISVISQGYTISSSQLYTTKNYGVKSQDLTLASSFSGHVEYNGTLPAGHLLTGIYDYSTVELTVIGSSISQCNTGIHKRNGKLTVRCSSLNNNRDVNIYMYVSSLLNMNSTLLGGYNSLYKTTNNKNIYLHLAEIDINNGYNFIEYVAGATITGGTGIYCSSCPTLYYTQNQWIAGSTAVPANVGTIYSSVAGVTYPTVVAPTATKPMCPIILVPGGPRKSLDGQAVTENEAPVILSSVPGDSIALDQLIYTASSSISGLSEDKHDNLKAIDVLDDVFTADIPESAERDYWMWFALDQMKLAVENAFADGKLSVEENQAEFDPTVAKYVNALNRMSETEPGNFGRKFMLEMDKAHLLRLTGHPEKTIELLSELEKCGLDSAYQAEVNYWKERAEKDLIIKKIGVLATDSVLVINTSSYKKPSDRVNELSFGAIIKDLNDIHYPECRSFAGRSQSSANDFLLFPNPATREVTLEFSPLKDGNGKITVQQADGRLVYEKSQNMLQNGKHQINVANWAPGIYNVRVTFPDGKSISQRLVVN